MSGSTTAAGRSAPVTPPDPEIKRVHDLVNSDGLFGLHRNEHLHTIQSDLKSLDASRVNATLDGMSHQDVQDLGSNLGHGGVWGAQGLGGGEKRALFDDLATKAGGPQLKKLSDGLNRDDKQMLAQSVASKGPPQTALGYVQAMAPATTRSDDSLNVGLGGSTIVRGSAEARAVGTVLASTRGDNADAAFRSLTNVQLTAVTSAAATLTTTTTPTEGGTAVMTHSYDTKPLVGIIDAAASGTDARMKAGVFEAGSAVISDIRGNDALLSPDVTAGDECKRTATALTGLLNSDTGGVVHALSNDQISGHALAGYAKEMVGDDRTRDLGHLMAKLQHGNAGSQPDAAKYFQQTETNAYGQPYYAHAQDLGYFSGAVEAGINSRSADRTVQANSLRTFFTAALFSANAAIPPTPLLLPVKIAVPIVNGLTGQAITDATAGMVAGDKAQRDAFNELALPRMGNSHDRYRGPGEADFLSYQNTVMLQNQ